MRYKERRSIILTTISVAAALLLAGCDKPQTVTPTSPTPVRKKAKLDKSAPINQRVEAIIVEQLVSKKELKPTDRLVEDLGADSLDVVELIMAFEEEFNLEIPDKEAMSLKTVGDCIAYLEKSAGKPPAK